MARLVLPDPPLGDGVIALRGFASCDVAALVVICQDPEIPRWTLVPDAHDGRMLGTGGLMAIDRTLACAEIGDMLDAPAGGRLRPDG